MDDDEEIEIGRLTRDFLLGFGPPKWKSRSRHRWLESVSAVTRRDPDFVRFRNEALP
jgi:hypothetical protein